MTIISMFSWKRVDKVSNQVDLRAFKFQEDDYRKMKGEKIYMSTEFIFYSFPSAILALMHYFTIGSDVWVIIKCVTTLISLIHIESFLDKHFESTDAPNFELEEPVEVQQVY
jgi:hypothetical protein